MGLVAAGGARVNTSRDECWTGEAYWAAVAAGVAAGERGPGRGARGGPPLRSPLLLGLERSIRREAVDLPRLGCVHVRWT